jgi:ribonucleotide reductase alpha subunit
MDYFLAKSDNKVFERPQHLYMKIAVSIHGNDIDSAIETYNMLSQKLYIFSPVVMRLQPATKKVHQPSIRYIYNYKN